jgi:hypothetical protein
LQFVTNRLAGRHFFLFFFSSIQSDSYQTGAWIISRGAEMSVELKPPFTSFYTLGLVFTSKHASMGVASFSEFKARSQPHSSSSVGRKMEVNDEFKER